MNLTYWFAGCIKCLVLDVSMAALGGILLTEYRL